MTGCLSFTGTVLGLVLKFPHPRELLGKQGVGGRAVGHSNATSVDSGTAFLFSHLLIY